jgi:AraC-like DNA-binding protein
MMTFQGGNMEYLTQLPGNEELRSSIAVYGEITGKGGISKSICPRPGTAMVISLAGSYRINGAPAPQAVVFGIHQHSINLEVDPAPMHRLQVQFNPCGLSRFTTASAASLAGRLVAAHELFAPDAIESLMRSLSPDSGLSQAAAILDRFFMDHYSPPTEMEQAVDWLARRICDSPDSLGALLREFPASLRQAERYFARLVGASPRSFARIARFEKAKVKLVSSEGPTLTDIGLTAGYYDQAHFGREFRRLASMAPGSYTACPPAQSPTD